LRRRKRAIPRRRDGKFGPRTALRFKKYRVSLTLVFGSESDRFAWMTTLPAVMEGEFDEKVGRAIWNVYVPSTR
jgi:hypothetical protein